MKELTEHTVTLTDPNRARPKQGGKGKQRHLLNNVPNTEANRKFWRAVGREARKCSSGCGAVRLRGRGSRKNGGNQSQIPLDKATHFAVYLDTGQVDSQAFNRGYEMGKRTGARKAEERAENALRAQLAQSRRHHSAQAEAIQQLQAERESYREDCEEALRQVAQLKLDVIDHADRARKARGELWLEAYAEGFRAGERVTR